MASGNLKSLRIHKWQLRQFVVPLLLVSLIPLCSNSCLPNREFLNSQPTNIILIIGDGLGLSQISLLDHDSTVESNSFLRFECTGLLRTSSSSHKITDSAAGATAYASGIKTYNGAIGVSVDSLPVNSIFEMEELSDWSKGIIVTSSIVHATPAAFFSNTISRQRKEEIAAQLHNSEIDFFSGGGQSYFDHRSDGRNYLDSLVSKGFEIFSADGIVIGKSQPRKGFFLSTEEPPRARHRKMTLKNSVNEALSVFNRKNESFFLVIEASQIDWGGHENDIDFVVSELRELNECVNHVLDFGEENGNTLVLVTGDHETGGLTLNPFNEYENNLHYDSISVDFSTTGHTAVAIPIFAFGPGAYNFTGYYENFDVFSRLRGLIRIGEK